MSAAERALVRVTSAFQSHGLLTHSVGGGSRWMQDLMRTSSRHDFTVERDCGEHCSAFTLLHPDLPLSVFASGDGHDNGIGLAFEASDEVWDTAVQCMSVLDSNSANRACCACFERQYCPLPSLNQRDSGYCHAACSGGGAAEQLRCKQLAAGCGVNTMTAHWERFPGQAQCSEQEIRDGRCRMCERPQWCADPGSAGFAFGGHADTPEKWLELFFHKPFPGTRQCKYKPSQKEAWIETAREYNRRRQTDTDNEPALENEVNLYVGPGDGGVEAALAKHFVGLLFFRTSTGQQARDLGVLRRLRDHLSGSLGWQVPIYAVTNEPPGQLRHWNHAHKLDLRAAPYNLQLVS